MDHPVDDPLGDPLDSDLEALLAVEPSAEFLARVRTRVASETLGPRWHVVPRSWSFQPLLAVGVAAIVLAVVIPMWLRSDAAVITEPRTVSTAPALQAPQRVAADVGRLKAASTTNGDGAAHTQSDAASDARGGRLQAARPDTVPFAEVLFSDEERRALLQLVTAVEEGRVPPFPPALVVDEEVPAEGTAMMIEPLAIDPLPQIARLEE
jgi:hypothetical protein